MELYSISIVVLGDIIDETITPTHLLFLIINLESVYNLDFDIFQQNLFPSQIPFPSPFFFILTKCLN